MEWQQHWAHVLPIQTIEVAKAVPPRSIGSQVVSNWSRYSLSNPANNISRMAVEAKRGSQVNTCAACGTELLHAAEGRFTFNLVMSCKG